MPLPYRHVVNQRCSSSTWRHLSEVEWWLRKWRIANNASKSSAMLLAKAGRRIPKPRTVQLFREPIQWVDTTSYFGVTLDTAHLAGSYRSGEEESSKETHRVLRPLLNRRSGLFIRNGVLLYKQLMRPMMDYVCPV